MSIVQPGEDVVLGGPCSIPQYPWESHQEHRVRLFTVVHGGRMRDKKFRVSDWM